MAQIFHPSFNTISKVSIFGAVFFVAAAAWALAELQRSPYTTQQGVAREQPVPFSHKHHVGGLGIDCRFCHTSVEQSAFAGLPPTKTCMTCHSLVWTDAPILEPVRESFRTNRSIEWVRVNQLPDFVYFDHSIHLAKGIGCASCHGRVDEMPLTWRAESLAMEWCLGCHRDPVQHVRPKDRLFDMEWDPTSRPLSERLELAREYGIQSLTSCYTCHR